MKKIVLLSFILILLSGCQVSDNSNDDQTKKELQSDIEDLESKIENLEDRLEKKDSGEPVVINGLVELDPDEVDFPIEQATKKHFELTSPDDGETFGRLPIIFKGTVSKGAESIVVTARGGGNEHAVKYKDVYELEDFKKDDRSFTYRAKPEWDNLAVGENEYEFEVLFDNGETLTQEVTVNYIYDGDGEIVFDGCGDPKKYKSYKWYGKLKDKFNALGLIAYQQPVYFDVWDKNFNDYGANELCYADNGGVVILVSAGEYCSFGNVYRYFVESNILEEASYPAKTGCSTLGEFQKREGNIVPMTGGFGDAGCFSDDYYNYDFIKNTITKNKSYSGCYDFDTDEKEGEWTYY